MKILQVHNHYQNPGGEDVTVAAEHEMLVNNGHEVLQWLVNNDDIQDAGLVQKFNIAYQSVWSNQANRQMKEKIRDFQPDVVHIHNTIPKLSPSIYAACHHAGVPVIQTLHNYRLICPKSPLYRDGHICEECISKSIPYPAVVHGCYRDSRIESIFATATLTLNRWNGAYSNYVTRYIIPNTVSKGKFVKGGLPAEKIVYKPHFLTELPPIGKHQGNFIFFAGRIVPHKGIRTLLEAWRSLPEPIPLKIAGKGTLDYLLKEDLPDGIEYLGHIDRDKVFTLMQEARLSIFPSEWYEPFGMTIIEAFAMALPVIASKIGAPAEIVIDGENGWHFEPGNPQDLARVVQTAWADTQEQNRRGKIARTHCEEYYTAEGNYKLLINIYQEAIDFIKSQGNS